MLVSSAAAFVSYVVLILPAIWRGGRQRVGPWLALYLAASAALAALPAAESRGLFTALHPEISLARTYMALLLVGVGLLGAVTWKYLNTQRAWLWPAANLALAAGVIAVDAVSPGPRLRDSSLLAALAQGAPAALAGTGLWLANGVALLAVSLRALRQARLPLHANRGLWWLFALVLVLAGEPALALGGPLAASLGQAIRLAGAVCAVYAATSARLVDVRGLLRSGLGNAVVVLFTAAVALLGIGLAQFISSRVAGQARLAAVLGVALLLALAYQLVRGWIQRLVNRAVLRADYDPAQVAREYSRHIATILDVDQLALAAAEALRQSVEAKRSALLLLTPTPDGIEVEAVPGIGPVPPEKACLAADNPVLKALTENRRPILQYDIDYNPQFRAAGEADSAWLRSLGMDVVAPMMDGAVLCGLLAAGPRASGDPYRRRELDLVSTLAEQTAVGLKNARLFTDLRRLNGEMQALNDSLQTSNEKLAAIDSAKTDFLSIASHELRTPLTQLRGYTDVLSTMNQAGVLKADTVEQLAESLSRACERMEQVIGQMLDVSQIDVAAMAYRFSQTTLAAVLKAALDPVAQAVRERRLTLATPEVDNLPPLMADGPRLAQALCALVGNAIKYTPDGGRIEVTATHLPELDGRPESIEVVVADTGVGVDPRYHELIFEKFFRAGSASLHSTGATKFMGAGPGLGLPLARGVVQGHGGRVWVESPGFNMEKLLGSRFHVWLPLRPPSLGNGEPVRLEASSLKAALLAEEERAPALPKSPPAPSP